MTNTLNLPVPLEIADEVRRFAAFILAERQRTSTTPAPSDGIRDYPLWANEDIVRFATSGTVTSRIYCDIMDAIIAHNAVGQWVTIAELADWTGHARSVIATFRTHLYRYINSRFPKSTLAPFTGMNGQDLRPARGREVHYRVSAECAEQWEQVRTQIGEF